MRVKIFNGDCLKVLKRWPDNSVDSIVTDPPYGFGFMGKKWDYDVPSVEIWRECLRVLKPGGHLLAFGGPRTYHRLAVNIEDAGFEIRDQIQWLFGSGFPKSLDISKAIDKAAGAKREQFQLSGKMRAAYENASLNDTRSVKNSGGAGILCALCGCTSVSPKTGVLYCGHPKDGGPVTDAAKQWQGWGTALKPANEPICLARKPISEKTVAANVLRWGTGGINVDGCRVGENPGYSYPNGPGGSNKNTYGDYAERGPVHSTHGRFPANLILDEEAGAMLDEQSGITTRKDLRTEGKSEGFGGGVNCFGESIDGFEKAKRLVDLGGGASRFFYVAKVSARERNAGLDGFPKKEPPASGRPSPAEGRQSALGAPRANHHPTVKPIKLMRYLCRLVTPPGGLVLDPFMGSGSTGVAAKQEKFGFMGIELSKEYYSIARARLGFK